MHITIWDFDIAFGNCDYEFNGTYCDSPTGFFIKDNCSWYSSLMANSQFREKVSKRWKELRKGILSDSQIESLISSQASIIKKSAEANDERWNIFGNRTWPNTEEIGRFTSYEQNVEHLINWVKRRADWLDDYL